MNKLKVLKTKKEYSSALVRLEGLFDSMQGTAQGNEAELLMLLIQDYELRNFKREAPDPVEAINFRVEQMNLRQTDLVKFIGSPSRVSEILNRKRNLTLDMIIALNAGLGIPFKSLLVPKAGRRPGARYNYPSGNSKRVSAVREVRKSYDKKQKGE